MYFYLYKDVSAQWRWRLVAANGKTIADSGEAYWNKSDALHGIQLVQSTNYQTPVKE